MSITLLELLQLPDEFTGMHCGLCGNSGLIDTVGKLFTAAGVPCGLRAFCLCANGRALKRARGEEKPKPAPELFWVSWESEQTKGPPPKKLDPRIIDYWCSGHSLAEPPSFMWCALIQASTVEQVITAVSTNWPCKGERLWRFIFPKPLMDVTNFEVGDRFHFSKAGLQRFHKFKAKRRLAKKKKTAKTAKD